MIPILADRGGFVNTLGRIVILQANQVSKVYHVNPQTPKWLNYGTILTCIGWSRVSDTKQLRGYSLASQQANLQDFASLCRMQCNGVLTYKARVKHRPLTGSMVASLQAVIDQSDILLVASLDRLTRQTLDQLSKRLHGTLYVIALGNGTKSEATRRSLAFMQSIALNKRTVHGTPRM